MLGRPPARIALLVLLVAVAAAAGYRWWASPERQVRRILDDTAAALTHAAPDSGLEALTAAAALQPHLAPDITVTPGGDAVPIQGRQEVVAAAARYRAATPMLRVRFYDPVITLGGEQGQVRATVEVTQRDAAGQDVVAVHAVAASVTRARDRWVVTSARLDPDRTPE